MLGCSLAESPVVPPPSLGAERQTGSQSSTQSHRPAGTARILQPSEDPGCSGHCNRSDFHPGSKVPGCMVDLVHLMVSPVQGRQTVLDRTAVIHRYGKYYHTGLL